MVKFTFLCLFVLTLPIAEGATPLLRSRERPSPRPARLDAPGPLTRLRGGEGPTASSLPSLLKLPSLGLPKVVDALLAGAGLATSLAIMGALESRGVAKLYAMPMMASGIIFFSNPAPPHPRAFLTGTLGCATLSTAVLTLLKGRAPAAVAQGAAAGALLVWYKLTSCIFPPAAVLCCLMLQAQTGSGTSALGFIAAPWLAGHACLYVGALGVGAVRGRARQSLTRAQLRQMSDGLSVEELRGIFAQFDTSQDGSLDANELKCALRVALGTDLTLEDCEELVRKADTDGNDTLSFGEFRAICEGRLE